MTTAKKLGFIGLVFLVVLILVAAYYLRHRHDGLTIVIRNDSSETLRHISVKVEARANRGKAYDVSEILPGKVREIVVQPITECHVNLEFSDRQARKETIIGYAEAGYCGKATVTIGRDLNVETIQDIHTICGVP